MSSDVPPAKLYSARELEIAKPLFLHLSEGGHSVHPRAMIAFLQASGLPKPILARIWDLTVGKTGRHFTAADFLHCLRLLAAAQSNMDLDNPLLHSPDFPLTPSLAFYKAVSLQHQEPRITGVAGRFSTSLNAADVKKQLEAAGVSSGEGGEAAPGGASQGAGSAPASAPASVGASSGAGSAGLGAAGAQPAQTAQAVSAPPKIEAPKLRPPVDKGPVPLKAQLDPLLGPEGMGGVATRLQEINTALSAEGETCLVSSAQITDIKQKLLEIVTSIRSQLSLTATLLQDSESLRATLKPYLDNVQMILVATGSLEARLKSISDAFAALRTSAERSSSMNVLGSLRTLKDVVLQSTAAEVALADATTVQTTLKGVYDLVQGMLREEREKVGDLQEQTDLITRENARTRGDLERGIVKILHEGMEGDTEAEGADDGLPPPPGGRESGSLHEKLVGRTRAALGDLIRDVVREEFASMKREIVQELLAAGCVSGPRGRAGGAEGAEGAEGVEGVEGLDRARRFGAGIPGVPGAAGVSASPISPASQSTQGIQGSTAADDPSASVSPAAAATGFNAPEFRPAGGMAAPADRDSGVNFNPFSSGVDAL